MKKESIKKFYKTIKVDNNRDHVLFDYEKIWADDAFIYLVISERGAKGKSTQAKRLARIIYEQEDLKTMWLMNTKAQIKKEKRAHLIKPHKYLRDVFTGNEHIKGDTVLTGDENDDWYTTFGSLTTAENEKSSREEIGLVIYDEFNVGTRMIKNSQSDLISSLIATLSDPVNRTQSPLKKFIIHGNFKSLNSEFLMDLGVTKIDSEVTIIKNSAGKPFMKILSPMFTVQDKKKLRNELKGDPVFELQKLMKKEDHVYFNENLFDTINNIDVNLKKVPDNKVYQKFPVMLGNRSYILKFLTNGKVFIYKVPISQFKDDTKFVIIDKIDVIENTGYSKEFKENLRQMVFKGILWYDSSYTRENLIKRIRK